MSKFPALAQILDLPHLEKYKDEYRTGFDPSCGLGRHEYYIYKLGEARAKSHLLAGDSTDRVTPNASEAFEDGYFNHMLDESARLKTKFGLSENAVTAMIDEAHGREWVQNHVQVNGGIDLDFIAKIVSHSDEWFARGVHIEVEKCKSEGVLCLPSTDDKDELRLNAVRRDGWNISYIAPSKRTSVICSESVKQNGLVIDRVPRPLLTFELERDAFLQNPYIEEFSHHMNTDTRVALNEYMESLEKMELGQPDLPSN